MKGSLKIVSGAEAEREIELETGSYDIGRSPDASIQIDSRQVSRSHAQIVLEKGIAKVIDSGSANGTLLNGRSVSASPLVDGDRIEIGDVQLEFHIRKTAKPVLRREGSLVAAAPEKAKAYVRSAFGTVGSGQKTLLRPAAAVRSASRRQEGTRPPLLSLKLILSILIGTLTSGAVVGTALLYRAEIAKGRSETALSRAQVLVRLLAEKNREEMRKGNDLLLDVDSLTKEPGVREALLLDSKGRILAPVSRMRVSQMDPFTAEALSAESDRTILPSPPLPDGSYILVHPIRAFSEKTGAYESLGVARLTFAPREASKQHSDPILPTASIVALLLGLAAGWLGGRLLILPISRLTERLESRDHEPHQPLLRELAPLSDAIDQSLEENRK